MIYPNFHFQSQNVDWFTCCQKLAVSKAAKLIKTLVDREFSNHINLCLYINTFTVNGKKRGCDVINGRNFFTVDIGKHLRINRYKDASQLFYWRYIKKQLKWEIQFGREVNNSFFPVKFSWKRKFGKHIFILSEGILFKLSLKVNL